MLGLDKVDTQRALAIVYFSSFESPQGFQQIELY